MAEAELAEIAATVIALEKEAHDTVISNEENWQENYAPMIKGQMDDLEEQVKELHDKIEKLEVEDVEMENNYRILKTALDATMKKYYGRTAVYSYGGTSLGGVFICYDDIWVEYGSGHVYLKVVPGKQPRIIMQLGLPADTDVSSSGGTLPPGLTLKLCIDNFKLRSGSNSGVPDLTFSKINVTAAVNVRIELEFDPVKSTWKCAPENFVIDLLDFSGPFGLSTTIVSAILSFITPHLRKGLVNTLPNEFGVFLQSMSEPFESRGDFSADGLDLELLTKHLSESDDLCSLIGCNKDQMDAFYALQRVVYKNRLYDSSDIMKSLDDFIDYRKKYKDNQMVWAQLMMQWELANEAYCSTLKAGSVPPCTLADIMTSVVERLKRKPMKFRYTLKTLELGFSLNNMLSCIQTMLSRQSVDMNLSDELRKMAVVFKDQFAITYEICTEQLNNVATHMTELDCCVRSDMKSGSNGVVDIYVDQVKISAFNTLGPFMKEMKEKVAGFVPFVPFSISTHTSSATGAIDISMAHIPLAERKAKEEQKTESVFFQATNNASGSNSSSSPHPAFLTCATSEPLNAAVKRQSIASRLQVSADRDSDDSDDEPLDNTEIIQEAPSNIQHLQVPHTHIALHLDKYVPFYMEHFVDMPKFRDFIERESGMKVTMDELKIAEIVSNFTNFYVLRPCMHLTLLLQGQLFVDAAREVIAKVSHTSNNSPWNEEEVFKANLGCDDYTEKMLERCLHKSSEYYVDDDRAINCVCMVWVMDVINDYIACDRAVMEIVRTMLQRAP